MQAVKLSAVLFKYKELMVQAGAQDAGDLLEQLALIFKDQKTKTIASLVNKVKKLWASESNQPSHPAILKSLLANIEAVHRESGPAGIANDFKKLSELFLGSNNGTIEQFMNDLRIAFEAAPARSNAESVTVPDARKVRNFADRLTTAIENRSEFQKLIDELGNAKQYNKSEVAMIADQFLGYHISYKTKKQAIEALRRRQLQEELGANQRREIEKLPV